MSSTSRLYPDRPSLQPAAVFVSRFRGLQPVNPTSAPPSAFQKSAAQTTAAQKTATLPTSTTTATAVTPQEPAWQTVVPASTVTEATPPDSLTEAHRYLQEITVSLFTST